MILSFIMFRPRDLANVNEWQFMCVTYSANLIPLLLRIIMKSLDPLRAKKIFIRKKLGHTAVSAIKASSVTL